MATPTGNKRAVHRTEAAAPKELSVRNAKGGSKGLPAFNLATGRIRLNMVESLNPVAVAPGSVMARPGAQTLAGPSSCVALQPFVIVSA